MKPNTIEVVPGAIAATIESLWGPQMVPVADRVYAVIDRIVRQQYQEGFQAGIAQGVKDAQAPSAVGETTPEALYAPSMWPPQSARDAYNAQTNVIQHDSGDEQPEDDYPHEAIEAYAAEFGERPENNACNRSSALCSNFPGCGCIA